jgi:hypothetical protein
MLLYLVAQEVDENGMMDGLLAVHAARGKIDDFATMQLFVLVITVFTSKQKEDM